MIIYLTFPPPASAINLTSVRRNQRLLLCAIAYFTDRAFEHFLICLHVPIFLNLHTVCIFLNQRKSYTLHFMSLNQGFKHPSPSCLLISRKIMDKYDQYCSNYGGRQLNFFDVVTIFLKLWLKYLCSVSVCFRDLNFWNSNCVFFLFNVLLRMILVRSIFRWGEEKLFVDLVYWRP